MTQTPTKEGDIPFNIPSIDIPCFTHYKLFGDLSSSATPVIVLHGGPGAGHEYMLPFAELLPRYGLPVIFYDQIGCAASTALPHKAGDREFWHEYLFVNELNNLLDFFSLRENPSGYHIFGQSWGGGLAAAFASSRPKGLRKLILASANASRELSAKGLHILIKQQPEDVQRTLQEAVEKNKFDTPEYQAAMGAFLSKHLCRADPFPPPELVPAMRTLTDKTVYATMYGPSPLVPTGSLQGWTTIPRLPNINVPTLVYNGEFDSSHDVGQVPFFELIPRVRWRTITGGSHMCHLEGPLRENVITLVGDFLTEKESV